MSSSSFWLQRKSIFIFPLRGAEFASRTSLVMDQRMRRLFLWSGHFRVSVTFRNDVSTRARHDSCSTSEGLVLSTKLALIHSSIWRSKVEVRIFTNNFSPMQNSIRKQAFIRGKSGILDIAARVLMSEGIPYSRMKNSR